MGIVENEGADKLAKSRYSKWDPPEVIEGWIRALWKAFRSCYHAVIGFRMGRVTRWSCAAFGRYVLARMGNGGLGA